MLTARSLRTVLAVAGVLAAGAFAGAQAASIPTMSTPTADTGIVKVHNYCSYGKYYVHYCKRWGYDSYGNKYCVKWGHRRQGYCDSYNGGSSGGSY
ncbi:MAG: hypothetical protein U1E49_12870 [Hyphomicrobiaceae bacterium]|mgnify:CR=1 FL=1